MKTTKKDLCKNAIQKLFFASEDKDINSKVNFINDDWSIRIVIVGTQDYSGSMYKHESVQGILKFNKVKLDWWEWEKLVDFKYILDSYIDDGSLIINLSQEVLEDEFISKSDMENYGLRHKFFNVLPYDMETV